MPPLPVYIRGGRIAIYPRPRGFRSTRGFAPGYRPPGRGFAPGYHPAAQGFPLGYRPAALQVAPGTLIRAVGPGDDSPGQNPGRIRPPSTLLFGGLVVCVLIHPLAQVAISHMG